jgi:hypothetical protein
LLHDAAERGSHEPAIAKVLPGVLAAAKTRISGSPALAIG